MFVSDSHLPHLLRPDQYCSRKQHDAEIEQIFTPGWHLICTTADLPKNGDFLTIELLKHPLLIRNFNNELHGFLNVCAHRHCRIACEQSGNSPELKCQYHGWEFDESGSTKKIPDARNFRPFPKGMVGLKKFRIATAGQLAFVSLAPNGPELSDYLGPIYAECCEMFSDEWEQIWAWQPKCEGNWKIAYEITLEGYHVATAHAETLGRFPSTRDENTTHELLTDRHSAHRGCWDKNEYPALKYEAFAMETCGGRPDYEYKHLHAYPNLGFISQHMFSVAQCILPIDARHHLNMYRVFVFRGTRKGILPWIVKKVAARSLLSLWPQTFQEDIHITTETQRGMESPEHADGGLISIREERVFHFQEYVKTRCDESP